MQHAIINAMKCMRAIKDRITIPVYQLEIISIEPLYHAQQVSRWKSSVRDLQDPSTHHSSVVFRHDKLVGHHSNDSVGLFRHDKSVGQSQRGSQSEHKMRCGWVHQMTPKSDARAGFESIEKYFKEDK
ncbi:serine carboxypeptidase-like 17 [Dorcoceras hygrometricum]|uniref:Serine carboxypeptidase-like 17 n=1 Tax=Dorcoceras hygrometricum TaxID=472368 RepID=A0A2Z7CWT9_9LAMI|nr:serine carboxypeptidase-like 17 [Dorcoceras hygrometricum]